MTHSELMTLAKTSKKLTKKNVKTMKDVDIYRYQQCIAKNAPSIKSRYQTLVEVYGQKVADVMMRNLEVNSWDMR
jgi:hypothetical protein